MPRLKNATTSRRHLKGPGSRRPLEHVRITLTPSKPSRPLEDALARVMAELPAADLLRSRGGSRPHRLLTRGPEPWTPLDPPPDRRNITRMLLPVPTCSARGMVRRNFASQHLFTAATLARHVHELEQEHRGAEFGKFHQDLLGYSVGAVVLAAASLEAYINEILTDRKFHFSAPEPKQLDDACNKLLKSPGILKKFDYARGLRDIAAQDRNSEPRMSAFALCELRNELMHFKPEWPNEALNHTRLSELLAPYIRHSEWLTGDSLFPKAWAGSESTAWAIRTALDFVAEFSAATGIEDKFAPHRAEVLELISHNAETTEESHSPVEPQNYILAKIRTSEEEPSR